MKAILVIAERPVPAQMARVAWLILVSVAVNAIEGHHFDQPIQAAQLNAVDGGPDDEPSPSREISSITALLKPFANARLLPIADDKREKDGDPPLVKELYVPKEKDFKRAFDSDKKNQKRQNWKSYYGWVVVFYNGNLLDAGWTARSRQLLQNVESEEEQSEIRRRLNELGRTLAAEWSKDNAVRRIDTAMLKKLGERLQRVKQMNPDSAQALCDELDEISTEVQERLSPKKAQRR